MFGLKIVKSQDYKDLNWRLEQTLALIDEQDARISELKEIISKKDAEIEKYKKSKKQENPVKNVVLLTDVAETPLIEEPKSEGKPKRVVKKTGETKTRRKVVCKTDEQ